MRQQFGKKLLAATAGMCLMAAGLVGVAAPASAGPHYNGNAWLDCDSGVKFATISGHGYGAGDMGTWKNGDREVIIKRCENLSESECPLVEASQEGQEVEPTPACWEANAGNNCPVGNALRFDAPAFAMVGVPITMKAYASWRPDENSPAQPTNGTAVIRVDGEDYSGVEFKDGIAEWRFIPETPGVKDFTASGVVFSGYSGADAYIDTVPASVQVLPYDPDAFAQALKRKAVEAGEKYTIVDMDQARAALAKRLEWNVSDDSEDVCAVYETKKGAVKAKFNGEGKCTVTWLDPKSGDEGKFTFIAKK